MDRLFTEAARKRGVGKYYQWYKGQYKGKDEEGGYKIYFSFDDKTVPFNLDDPDISGML